MAVHPDWDPGAWDARSSDEKRAAVKARKAPPACISTWRDARAGDGSRQALFKRKKTDAQSAVTLHTPPVRVDATHVRIPLVGDIEVVTRRGLPDAARLLACRVCVRCGRSGRTRVEIHFAVRIDVRKRRRRPHGRIAIAGGDMACAETVRWHDAKRLKLPDHDAELERALGAQQAMDRAHHGSRRWTAAREEYRGCRTRMRARDTDAIRKAAHRIAQAWDVVTLEDVQSKSMTASARGRAGVGVNAKRALNRRIRRACWGIAQRALHTACENVGGLAVQVIAAYSSQTCSACGHIDARSRKGKEFDCTWCGHTAHADVNAANVIRARARALAHLARSPWLRCTRARGASPRGARGATYFEETGPGGARTSTTARREGENQAPGRRTRKQPRREGCGAVNA